MNAIWTNIFSPKIQECFDEFEYLVGESSLPVSFSFFLRTFFKPTDDKIAQYETAVLQCKQEIESIREKLEDDPEQVATQAKTKIAQLRAYTLT